MGRGPWTMVGIPHTSSEGYNRRIAAETARHGGARLTLFSVAVIHRVHVEQCSNADYATGLGLSDKTTMLCYSRM
nr:hypothetical protein CFP56_72797 [Quercus suber]